MFTNTLAPRGCEVTTSVPRCPGARGEASSLGGGAAGAGATEGGGTTSAVPTATGELPAAGIGRASAGTDAADGVNWLEVFDRLPSGGVRTPTATPTAKMEKRIVQRDTSRRMRTVFRRRNEFQFRDLAHRARSVVSRCLI